MPTSTQNSGVDDPKDSSNASSVRYIPGLNFLPNSSSSMTTSSPMRHRHLNDLVNSASSSTSSIDSPPRKLSAAVSASGNGAPSPRRKPRRRGNAASKKIATASVVENGPTGVAAADANGDNQQQQQQPPKTSQRQQQRKKKQTQQQQQEKETARQLNSSITNYFPVSPKYGANNNNTQNNNNNNNDVDGEGVNNGITALSGITHLCNGNSTSKQQQQQQQQPATTATPGKKKKRRRKKTTANADASSSSSTAAATAAACPHHHGLLSPTSASKNDGGRIQSQLTDFYQVRRSDRRPKSEKDKEEKDRIVRRIKDGSTDGLRVDDIPMKGRGVVADKNFRRGEFVIEYDGDLIDCDKAKLRETEYRSNPSVGCYMYYFTFQNRKYCVDATSESGKLGRLINHSTKTPNLTTRLFPIGDRPHLIFIAARDIDAGEELMYDYGDRSKEATEAHPWLKT